MQENIGWHAAVCGALLMRELLWVADILWADCETEADELIFLEGVIRTAISLQTDLSAFVHVTIGPHFFSDICSINMCLICDQLRAVISLLREDTQPDSRPFLPYLYFNLQQELATLRSQIAHLDVEFAIRVRPCSLYEVCLLFKFSSAKLCPGQKAQKLPKCKNNRQLIFVESGAELTSALIPFKDDWLSRLVLEKFDRDEQKRDRPQILRRRKLMLIHGAVDGGLVKRLLMLTSASTESTEVTDSSDSDEMERETARRDSESDSIGFESDSTLTALSSDWDLADWDSDSMFTLSEKDADSDVPKLGRLSN